MTAPAGAARSLVAENLALEIGGRRVLTGVTAHVRPGQIVAVVGANGAGKSTLLKALAGLLRPADGAVRFAGRSLAQLTRAELARAIAYLPQARAVHWPVSVERIVALGRLPHASGAFRASAADAAPIDAAIAAMGLSPLVGRPATELSGGELARVLLARALAQEAQVLIADEPTAGLDLAHVLDLFAHLQRLAGEGRTVIVALHDLALALRFCHHTVLLGNGGMLGIGASGDVLTPETIRTAFAVDAIVTQVDQLATVLARRSLT